MRNKQDPVEFVLEENPELDWDDIHDVRTVAELLGGMVEDLEEIREDEMQLKDGMLTVTVPGDSKVRRVLVMWCGTSDGLLFSPDGSTRDGGKHFSMFWNGGRSS